ncbi:MAG: SOSS complex subunit B family protein [Candidatus Methanospirareceae archaeon]
MNIIGKVLRLYPLKEVEVWDKRGVKDEKRVKKVIDAIVANEFGYVRVSFWDDKAELVVKGWIKVGDVLKIENAYGDKGEKKVNVGRYTRIEKLSMEINALSAVKPTYLTVLAVARPEKGQICVAGIDENGEWIRPQGVYENDVYVYDANGREHYRFKNLCISKIYVDTWKGRNPRKEDRFFVDGRGVERELSEEEREEFLEKHTDPSVDAVFKSGRSLGLIKPRILRVYEERRKKEGRNYEQYIRFDFKDSSGRIYRRWSCRCDAFYKLWNDLKEKHRWTYRLRMLRYLKKNPTYLSIGLTYTDYGRKEELEYGAYPMIVGVHVLSRKPLLKN